MKTRIIILPLFVALFVFMGNAFALDENTMDNPGPTGTEGVNNTFYGLNAGEQTTTGTSNTFLGRMAGYWNAAGSTNTFAGNYAGFNNYTGNSNTFVGDEAGHENQYGSFNTFLGQQAGYNNNTGTYNTFLGFTAGYSTTSGKENTFVGDFAGRMNNGSGNVFLGNEAGRNETASNKLYIDNSQTSNPLIWGDFSTNNVVVYGGFRAIASYSSSDKHWKKDIQPLQSSLEKVSSLQGVTYEWKMDEFPNLGLTKGKQIGLIAQDVEKELPELVSEDKDGYKAVSYTKLTAVLVEAVKELKQENQMQKELLQQQIQKQKAEIEELRLMIKELKS